MIDSVLEGIIVRTYETGDSNLVLRVITKDLGKLVFFAPFAKKSTKRFGKLDIFDWGKFTFKSKDSDMLLLNSFDSISSFPKLRDTFEKLILSSFLAEVFDAYVPENDPHSTELFKVLVGSLKILENEKDLKLQLKSIHNSLFLLLRFEGVEPKKDLVTPSLNNLTSLIMLAENHAEKRFETSSEIKKILEKFSV